MAIAMWWYGGRARAASATQVNVRRGRGTRATALLLAAVTMVTVCTTSAIAGAATASGTEDGSAAVIPGFETVTYLDDSGDGPAAIRSQMTSKQIGGSANDAVEIVTINGTDVAGATDADGGTDAGPEATVTIIYNTGFNNNAAAKASFEAAIDVWASTLSSTVPIVIDARFQSSTCTGQLFSSNTLGTAGPFLTQNFPGAPFSNTFYPMALANAISGMDLYPPNASDPNGNPQGAEICAALNSTNPDWYFGTDGNTPAGKVDFMSVVLHEIGHGLGFSGSMRQSSPSEAAFGIGGTPFVYDRFTTRGNGTGLLSLANPSAALLTALQSNDVFFRGTSTNAATSPGGAKLFAPATFQGGSSYSHLDEDTFDCTGTPCTGPNTLMTPSFTTGEFIHSPGPIALAMFEDMGWEFATALSGFTVTAASPQNAGSSFNVTVTAKDQSNNTLTNYAGTVHFSTTAGSAVLPADSTLTNGTGTFPVTLNTSGSQTITVTDTLVTAATGTSNAITVNAGPASALTLNTPSQVIADEPFNFTVTARDSLGNVATSYAGTVHFTSSGTATLPADSTLTAGTKSFQATMPAGTQTITATDTVNAALTVTSLQIIASDGSGFHALEPSRILDSRVNNGFNGKVGQTPRNLPVLNRGGVPSANVAAIVINVTVTNGTSNSFLTAFPAGATPPNASNLNFAAGQTIPNLVVVKLGSGGMVSFVNAVGQTDVIADVVGWYDDGTIAGDRYNAVTPARVLDSRFGPGFTGTVAQTPRNLDVTGHDGVPGTDVTAVVMNVTVTGGSANSFLTAFPAGTTAPNASNVNFAAGQTIPNLVVVKVGTGGNDGLVSFVNAIGNVHVVADIVGYFTSSDDGGGFISLEPARILDSRLSNGFSGKVGTTAKSLDVRGKGGVPMTGVSAIVINVTVTEGSNNSFLTVFPGGTTPPNASNLNFAAGETIPNLVVVKVGTGGSDGLVNFINAVGQTHVIADVVGWYST